MDSPRLKNSWNRAFLAAAASFAIIYNISFLFNESLSTGRLAVVFLVAWFLTFDNWRFESIDWGLLAVFLPFPYVLAQLFFDRDFGQFSRFFHLAFYSYLGAFLIWRLSIGLNNLLIIFLLVIGVQAAVLLFSFVSIDYRIWVGSIVATSANFDAGNIYRAPGFTSSAGSALSVIQSLGVLVGGFYLLRRKGASTAIEVYLVFLLMILCVLSCVTVGRTGLVLSGIFFVLFARLSGQMARFFRVLIIFVAPIVGYLAVNFEDIVPAGFSIDYFTGWAFGFLIGSDSTAENLAAMPIAGIGLDTIFGSGLVSIVDGANPSGHDSGFVQNYFSMGLVNAIVLYVAYIFVLYRLLFWLPMHVRFILTLVFFMADLKEPFLFKYTIMFILVALYLAARSERRSCNCDSAVRQ